MIKKIIGVAFLFFSLFSFSQVKNPEYQAFIEKIHNPHIPLISIDSFKNLKNKVVLDVREKEEFKVSHLKNARHVGYIWFDMRDIYDIPKSASVILYSTTGERCEKIAKKLLKAGYEHTYCLYGSLVEWVNEGNPVYTSRGIQTTEVHTYNKDKAHWLIKGTKVY